MRSIFVFCMLSVSSLPISRSSVFHYLYGYFNANHLRSEMKLVHHEVAHVLTASFVFLYAGIAVLHISGLRGSMALRVRIARHDLYRNLKRDVINLV